MTSPGGQETRASDVFASYAPRLAAGWVDEEARSLRGSLVIADLSGFTRLTERLARLGDEGAEIVTDSLSPLFAQIVEVLESRGGDVLFFGGDAVTAIYTAAAHASDAVDAAREVQRLVKRAPSIDTPLGRVRLRLSVAVHRGTYDAVLLEGRHRLIALVGAATDSAVALDKASRAGEIVISDDVAAELGTRAGIRPDGVRTTDIRGSRTPLSMSEPRSATSPSRFPGVEQWTPLELRQLVEAGIDRAEHRLATWAFLRIPFDGGAHGATQLRAAFATVDDLASRHGVCILSPDLSIGSVKLTLLTGLLGNAEQSAEQMLGFLASLADAPGLEHARAGCAAGNVFIADLGSSRRRALTIMGDNVNLAARLMQRADPGEVLVVDSETIARTDFALDAIAPFRVRGRTQIVNALRLIGAHRRARPVHAFPLRGRAAEVDTVLDAAVRARTGKGTALWIVGDAGAGKTRIAEACLERRPTGLDLAAIRARPADRVVPFSSVGRLINALDAGPDDEVAPTGASLDAIVRRAAPELGELIPLLAGAFGEDREDTPATASIDEQFRSKRTTEAVTLLLVGLIRAPTLVFLDDLHHLDQSSLEVVLGFARHAAALPLLLLGTTRPELSESLVGTQLRISGLEPESTRQIAIDHSTGPLSDARLDRIIERAAGNAMFVAELARLGDDDALPESVGRLIEARVDRLGPTARETIRVAAVIGDPVPIELVELLGSSPAIDAAWSDVLRRSDDDTYTFVHDLVRECVYRTLPYSRRRAIHARLAAVLEPQADLYPPAVLAVHFRGAADAAGTWVWACRAADDAARRSALSEACGWWRDALRATERLPDLGAAVIVEVAERAALAAGRIGESRLARDALQLASRHSTLTIDTARLVAHRGTIEEKAGRYTSAVRWFSRGLRLLNDAPDAAAPDISSRLLLGRGGVRYFQGRLADALDDATSGLALAERAGDKALMAQAHLQLEMVLSDLGSTEADEHGRDAFELFEAADDQQGLGTLSLNVGVTAAVRGDGQAASLWFERSGSHFGRSGDVVGRAAVINNLAALLDLQGRWREALVQFDEAERIYAAGDHPMGVALTMSGRSHCFLRDGRTPEAFAELARARESFEALGSRVLLVDADVRLVELLVFSGRPSEALERCITVEREMKETGETGALRSALTRLRALATAACGDRAAGYALTREALDIAVRSGAHFEAAFSLEVLHALAPRDSEARAALNRELADAVDRLGIIELPGVPSELRS